MNLIQQSERSMSLESKLHVVNINHVKIDSLQQKL